MKKTAFVCSFAISIMLFSCASDATDSAAEVPENHPKIAKTSAKKHQPMHADSLVSTMDKTTQIIDRNINLLNKAEADLDKAFDF